MICGARNDVMWVADYPGRFRVEDIFLKKLT